jgi:hypothetical protein
MTEAVGEAITWIYKMFVTLVLAVICVAIVGLFFRIENNTVDMQRELIFNRVLYDPQGFLYVDDKGVAHTAVFDKALFEQTRVNEVFEYKKNYGGAEVTLIDAGDRKTVYINPETYASISVSSKAKIKGGGSLVTRTYPVTIRDGGVMKQGWVNVTVAVPYIA